MKWFDAPDWQDLVRGMSLSDLLWYLRWTGFLEPLPRHVSKFIAQTYIERGGL